MRYILLFTFTIGTLLISSCKSNAEKDATRMAELFCRQSKIVAETKNLNDPKVQKELADIAEQITKINEELTTKYSKDPKMIDDFGKAYQKSITNCK